MRHVSKNRGFTLIELILVIIIIGVVYGFVSNSIFSKKNSITLKIDNFPEVARELKEKPAKFLLYGLDCDKYVWLGKEGSIDFEFPIEIDGKDLIPYRFNNYGELEEFQFNSFRVDNRVEKVCLKFEVFENGSNSSYIIEDEKSKIFYLFHPYFKPVEKFKTLQEAKEALLNEELNI
jgi:prepilin-type N-terminal cleavage/methylation domain-containing protein